MSQLTLKQKRFINKVITMPQGKAYQSVYECKKTSADTNASRLLSQAKIRDRAEAILQETKDEEIRELIISLKSLTLAQKQVILRDRLQDVTDNPTRLEAIKTLCRIYGIYNGSVTGSYQDNRSINIQVNSADVSILSDVVKRLSDIELRQDKVSGLIQVGSESGEGVRHDGV